MTLLPHSRLQITERLLPALDWLAARGPGARRLPPEHLRVGERGEECAYFHLRRLGWNVVARQWRSPKQPGDLDLVAWDGETLCFVEVKTRSSHGVATAEAAVDADKRRTVRRMARLYLKTLPSQPNTLRFDILSVYLIEGRDAEFRLIPAAFGWSEPAHRWN